MNAIILAGIMFTLNMPVQNPQQLMSAVNNIISELNIQKGDEAVVVSSTTKATLANAMASALTEREIAYTSFHPTANRDSIKILSSLITEESEQRFFIFFTAHEDAAFLFEFAGRPDLGIKIPEKQLFSDWLVPEDVFIRLESVDATENAGYQQALLAKLNTTHTIRVTTEAGTDISFVSRNWITSFGEVFCTPLEDKTNGIVVVDGCVFTGPPQKPVRLEIVGGRVTNAGDLSDNDQQERMMKQDFAADKNSTVLSEVGIGTNKNALWTGELMESEQARRTCHFGFGKNIEYGGTVENDNHFDFVVLNPTITIDGKMIYDKGLFVE